MAYKITVKQGNLLREKADFIVNTSNTRLFLGCGVSLAFKRHCGHKLQNEMDEVIKSMKTDLIQGDIVLTSAQKATNFKYALHIAIMNYNQGIRGNQKNPTIEIVSKSLFNIEKYLLLYAQKSKTVKVAIPLIGCGTGGLDKKKVINLYREFFSRSIEIDCEVVVYGYSIEDYNQIIKVLKNRN